MLRRLSILFLAGLLSLSLPALAETQRGAAASTITLDQLLARFRQVKGLEAKFREEKRMAMLAAPLTSEGTIQFAAPDRLLRRTTKPSKSTMVINGSKLSFNDGQSTETMSLDGNPVAKLFVDSFLKILVGDTEALTKLYDMSFKPGTGEAWELHLKPKVDPMNKVIAAIDLSGSGLAIEKMRILEVGGDETITTYSSVDTSRNFNADEQKKLFAITSP